MTDSIVQLAQVMKQNSLRKLQQNFFLPQIDAHKKPPALGLRQINTAGESKRIKQFRDNERTESEEPRTIETQEGRRKVRESSSNQPRPPTDSSGSQAIVRFLPDSKEKLRHQFIETALSYTGVPYSKK